MRREPDPFHRIKEALRIWASLTKDRHHLGYPSGVPYLSERVQANRSTDSYVDVELPDEIKQLVIEIHKMPRLWIAVINYEYKHTGTQDEKAKVLGMKREVFSRQLKPIYEYLDHAMYPTHPGPWQEHCRQDQCAYQ